MSAINAALLALVDASLAGEVKAAVAPPDAAMGGGAPGGMPPGAPPMDPSMGGAPPMDPAAMGGMPPGAPPADPGAMPGGDIATIVQQAVQQAMAQSGGGAAGAPMQPKKADPAVIDARLYKIERRLDAMFEFLQIPLPQDLISGPQPDPMAMQMAAQANPQQPPPQPSAAPPSGGGGGAGGGSSIQPISPIQGAMPQKTAADFDIGQAIPLDDTVIAATELAAAAAKYRALNRAASKT